MRHAANNEGHLWSINLPPIGAEQFAGGVVLSDDIHMSKAFARFITGKQVGLSLAGLQFGVAFKR